MNPSANVHNVDGLTTFQSSLQHFQEKAKDALMNIDMDLRRTQEWLEDQYSNWQTEIRLAEEAMTQAMLELKRKKLMKVGERTPDTSEEEKQVKKCKARLEHAEDKAEKTKHWLRAFPEAILDYEGPGRQLKTQVENSIPLMTAFLTQKIAALEQYQQLG
jgi:multidrug resistance efflux pump